MGIDVTLDERAFVDLVSLRCSHFADFSDAGLRELYKRVCELVKHHEVSFDLNRIETICEEYTEYSSKRLLEEFPDIVYFMDKDYIISGMNDSVIDRFLADEGRFITDPNEQITYLKERDNKLLVAYIKDPIALDILIGYAIQELNDYIPDNQPYKKMFKVVTKDRMTWIVPTETELKWLIEEI